MRTSGDGNRQSFAERKIEKEATAPIITDHERLKWVELIFIKSHCMCPITCTVPIEGLLHDVTRRIARERKKVESDMHLLQQR